MRRAISKNLKQIMAASLACAMAMSGVSAGNLENGGKVYAATSATESDSPVGVVTDGSIDVEIDTSVQISTADAVKIESLYEPISNWFDGMVDYSYVYFGEYPQSEVTGTDLTTEIVNAQYVNGDASVEDEKYRRLEGTDGTYRYFLYEPIRWRVICMEDYEAVLRSDLILDSQVFSNEPVEYWIDTSLRSWLNSYDMDEKGFLKTAFTNTEIEAINAKLNRDNYSYGASARDKVYLLSGAQLNGMADLQYPYELKTKASGYAFANGVSGENQNEGYAGWWVNSQQGIDYDMGDLAGYVDASGVRYQAIDDKYCTNNDRQAIPQTTKGIGVCPTIVLDLSKTSLWNTHEEMLQGNTIDRDGETTYIEIGKCGENVNYRIENGILYITGSGTMYDYKQGKVTPFQSRPDIQKIVIEEGVENVGDWMFCRIMNLEEVVLPESLKEIGYASFYNCEKLHTIKFPANLEKIDEYAFELCTGLTEVLLPDSITVLGEGAFANCLNLEKIQLPANLEAISEVLCYRCNLSEVTIPENVVTIGNSAFCHNTNLHKVVMGDKVVSLGESVFKKCTSLQEVVLSNHLETIGKSAFKECTNMETINIPETLEQVGAYVFDGTKWLTEQRNKNSMVIINGILIDMYGCVGEVVLPETVKKIGPYPNFSLFNITKLVIPSTVEVIDDDAINLAYVHKDAWRFCVEEGSAGESYAKKKGWSGYYLIKANGEIEQIILEGASMSPTPSVEPTEDVGVTTDAVKLGDVDRDKKIHLTDAQKILKYALKIEVCTEEIKLLADANEDNSVTLEDAQLILKAALKIIPWEKYVETKTVENRKATVQGTDTEYDLIDTWEPFMEGYGDPDFYIAVPAMKPVIYLYPEETTEIEVKLDFNGDFTFTWPDYREGWKVIAEPDGKLTDTYDGSKHYYLFWEGTSNVQYTFQEGFCVKGKDTAAFLKWALEEQGLTPKEYNDFITFWVPRMQDNEYNVISFVEEVYTDNAELSFSMEPDTMKRVFMAWYGSDELVDIKEQELTGFEREGFTVVEWGGAEVPSNSYKK